MSTGKFWTPHEKNRLREMIIEGRSTRYIMEKLDRSAFSVNRMIAILGLARPYIGVARNVSITISKKEYEGLSKLASARGMPRARLIRRLIQKEIENELSL